MTVPTFVTIGALASSTSAVTTATPALPASRVNGNVLIAFVEMNGSKVFSLSAGAISNGWNLYGTAITGNVSQAFAWRIVDGNESACSFTWTTGHAFQAICLQYTGNDTSSPIGDVDTNTGTTTIQGTIGVTSTRANSGVVALIALQTIGTPSTPSGWVSRNNNTLTAAGTIASRTLTAGLVNLGDNTNPSFGNSSGNQFGIQLIEILSPSAVVNITTTIDQTLPAMTQSIQVSEVFTGTAEQTLFALSQDFEAINSDTVTIAQTLPSIVQENDATVVSPVTHIDQTLHGFTQVLNGLMVPNADIATTLFAPTQSLTGGEQPNAVVATTLFPPTQALNASAVLSSTIAQTLPGFTQEIDDTVIADKATINMILGAKNASASAVNVGERTHTGNFIGHPTVSASAFAAGSMVVAVLSSVSTGAGRTVTSIDTVPGQPAWQKRSSFAGSQQASGVGLEVWWFIATGFISPTTCQVVWSGNLSSWENVCIEYANVDPAVPWDLDPSLPATSSNSSLNSTATPNITGLSTRSDHSMLVGFFGANTGVSPTPLTGYTKDVFEAIGGSAHTSSTITEVSKSVDLPQSGIAIGLATGGTAWNFIADAIRPQQLTTALTQDAEVTVSPAGAVDIVLSLQTISQSVDVTVDPAAQITTLFQGFVQEELDVTSNAGIIVQTLPGFTQEIDDHVTLPGNEVAGQTDQTFEGLTQRIDIVSYAGVIDQTFEGLTQRADVDEELPSDIVEQSLFAIQMEADVVEIFPFAIDQTLPGIVQEIDVVESVECTVDQTLASFGQEMDVSVLRIDIDQALSGFTQELDATETDPPGVIGMRIDQTLAGFQQEIDVSTLKCDVAVELHGLTQRAVLHVREAMHPRQNFGAIMPSKEMPIHPGELELFRGGRVNAMVPPTAVAYQNLTTARYPGGRSPVAAIPPLVKPR